MSSTEVILELVDGNPYPPVRAYDGDACMDIHTPQRVEIDPGQTLTVPIGLKVQLPEGWEAQIRGRSGLAAAGLDVHLGTIDHLYRKSIRVIMRNESGERMVFEPGSRIAQIFFHRIDPVTVVMGRVQDTDRGGLGSTGMAALEATRNEF